MRRLALRKVNPADYRVHGGLLHEKGGRPVVDFSSNINPLGPPASVMEALRRNLGAIAHYPDPHCTILRAELAVFHDIDPEQIKVGNGVNELIHAIALKVPAHRAAIVEPTYGEYLAACLDSHLSRDLWVADGPDFALEPFDPGRADLIWLCNPNNPTGRLWPHDRLLSWIKSFPKKTFVVDESFLPFRDDEPQHSLVRATTRLKNIIVLRSLTKFYALPGLRLGYLVANPSKFYPLSIDWTIRLPCWSVNGLAQIAGAVALQDQRFARETRAWLSEERDNFLRQLQRFPFTFEPVPTEANFVLIRLRRMETRALARRLLAAGIVVREGLFPGLGVPSHYVRVAIRTRSENQRLVEALKSILVSENGHQ